MRTPLAGAWILEPEIFPDARGYFARLFSTGELRAHGVQAEFPHVHMAHNRARGTIRGMHMQAPPHDEVKIVRCSAGRIWDVALDLRAGSPTFGRWHAVELTAADHRMYCLPQGIAHGYQTLEDDTRVEYHISAEYTPSAAVGVRYDDPRFGISWPLPVTVISERDRTWPDYTA